MAIILRQNRTIRRNSYYALILALACLLLSACPQSANTNQQSNTSTVSSSTSKHAAVNYPTEWPDERVRLPDDAVLINLPGQMFPGAFDGNKPMVVIPVHGGGTECVIAFRTELTWTELKEFYSKQLSEAGYRPSSQPQGFKDTEDLKFETQALGDWEIEVRFTYEKFEKNVLREAFEGYYLTISKLK